MYLSAIFSENSVLDVLLFRENIFTVVVYFRNFGRFLSFFLHTTRCSMSPDRSSRASDKRAEGHYALFRHRERAADSRRFGAPRLALVRYRPTVSLRNVAGRYALVWKNRVLETRVRERANFRRRALLRDLLVSALKTAISGVF